MELSQLRALLVLRDTCSLARAGEQLHLSTPAVFSKIRQLEDEIGSKLYERIGRRLELTNVGRLLAEQGEALVRSHDALLSMVREKSGSARSPLRLGSGPHSSVRIVPELLQRFLAAHPNADIRFETSDDQNLLRNLRTGLLDAVLMTLPVNDSELIEHPLWNYEMVFVLPPGKAASSKRERRVEDLKDRPFILYRRAVVVESAVRQLCRTAGFEPRIVMENDQPDSIKALVRLGLGVSVLPFWTVGDDCKRGLVRVLRPAQPHFQVYGVLTRRSEYRPRILDDFLAVAREWPEWWPLAKYVAPTPGVL